MDANSWHYRREILFGTLVTAPAKPRVSAYLALLIAIFLCYDKRVML